MATEFNTYPYTDLHELNLDWIIAQISDMQNTVDALNARFSSLDQVISECNAYTDDQVSNLKTSISSISSSLTELSATTAAALDSIREDFEDADTAIQVDVNNKYVGLNNKINDQWTRTVDYIANQIIDAKVRNYFTGQLTTIQSMFNYLASLHNDNAGTYTDVSGHNTYEYYIAQNKDYQYVVMNSGTFFV